MQEKIIKYRHLIVITAVAITLMSLLLIPRLTVNPNLDEYVPDHIQNKVYMRKLDSIFGGSETILVMLHAEDVVNISTLDRLKSLADDLSKIEGIDRCISPFDALEISYEDGFMLMEPLLEEIPDDISNYETIKNRILANNMASRFFAEDFSLVSIILAKNNYASDTIIDEIREVIANHPGSEEVLIGGLPFIRYSISGNIKSDMVVLVPLAMVLMVFMLYFSFREWKGVLLPFIIVAMSIILSFGVMALLGWKISLITILMPIMLIAIANDYGIHMIARYQELTRGDRSLSMKQISMQIYTDLKRPIITTGLTTIGGVLGLLTHTMIPAAQLGVLTAVGISFALVLSIWFLPAVLSYFKLPEVKAKARKNKMAPADRWLHRFSRWATHHPKRIVTITTITGIIGVMGIFFLKVDTNIEGYFLGKSEVRHSAELINNKFGGSQFISVLFSGEVLEPEVLKRMEGYEEEILKDPSVGHVNSPVTLIKELSKGFYTPDEEGYNQIPASADEAFQFIEVFAMGGNEEAVEQFIDFNYEYARMLISLKDGSNHTAKRVQQKLQELTREDPDVEFITGDCLTKVELADMVVDGQVKSLAFAMVVVFILLSLVFRSVKAGLISSVPLSVAILVLFGLMGILGIALDIATALLSSIMIGVGVDYTIHFLWRFKVERARGADHREAAHITLVTAGRGIIFNAVSVIVGFLALSLSNFAPMRFFSALVVISISSCLISALLLVPAIVILTKPKFLETV
ncbi:MAG: RND family transporter [Bacteroidia bacterium]|nr:MAG: RND family transporter [Bacteroidia bacterium]